VSGLGITLLTSSGLMAMKRRALRRGLWFKVLDRVERSIVDLTISCVDRVRSPRLAGMLVKVWAKLVDAMKSRMVGLMQTIGRALAKKIAELAVSWGNREAHRWANEPAFIQYLVVKEINTLEYFGNA